jgi:mono/diheme cytochrome c family protein
MIRKVLLWAAAAAVLGLAAFWILTIPATVPDSALVAHTPDLANGREMYFAGGCASCHAVPNQPDRTRLGSGLALSTRFGTFYVPNISSDAKDGIGGWSEAQFVTAMTRGTSPSGQHLYPAFPYTSYALMNFDDLRDLFAYLKTLPPVAGIVRNHELRFPFNVRRGLGLWKLLFLRDRSTLSDPSQVGPWFRGQYLVNGPGHCGECHSPRNAFGAVIESSRFTGGPAPDGQGSVPDITERKLGKWSEADIIETLTTGITPDSDRVGGSMIEVVRNTSQLSAADRYAIATYLKSLPVECSIVSGCQRINR